MKIENFETVDVAKVRQEDYSLILKELYKFINSFGDFDYLPDVILEFGYKNNYPPEMLADIISDDSSFKLALELNCISQRVFKDIREKKELEEW